MTKFRISITVELLPDDEEESPNVLSADWVNDCYTEYDREAEWAKEWFYHEDDPYDDEWR